MRLPYTSGVSMMQPGNRGTKNLTSEQLSLVDALLNELLDLPEEERMANLGSRRIEDAAVAAEVASLLRATQSSQGFMRTPARPEIKEFVPDTAVGLRLGAWRITRLIGRGGMGEVYEAKRADGDFEQRVAIKVLQPEAAAQLDRFQAERRILAKLEHPGIARLYDGGVAGDGRPFMVMEYVEGRTLTEFCAQTHATFAERLELFIQVCDAVAFAHRNLIVHRDLKPTNILVTAGGTVKLLDFGIAKLLDAELSRVTLLTAAPLSPACAAPEQLTGDPITTATDVYALGLLLFELLTGDHPWLGTDVPMLQAMRTVLQRPAPLASSTAEASADAPVPVRLIRGDMDAIIAKALRKEPVHRYATVAALKLDVIRVLRGEPVEAREGARLYVIGRVLRRHRWAAAAVLAVFVSLAGGLGVAAWQAKKVAVERDAARRDAAREEAVRYSLTRMFRAAIADQGAQSTTAKGMIDSSAQRVLREYHDQPQLAGQIVLTLADLYGALEDVTGAGALLEGFVAEANPDADPVALADARSKLANIELLRGHPDRAAELLAQADAFWARYPQLYSEERLEGLIVRARLQRTRGDLDGAIATIRHAIAERIALSGHDHRETAVLYNSLAISLTSANRLDEALAAYHETTAIYRALGQGDGLDAEVIVANTGTLELRIGHLRQAETLLKGAIERERSLAGDSAAVAAAMGYYGRVLAITNRNSLAVADLREATDIAVRYAGAGSPLAVQNRLFLGEAQLSLGDQAAAGVTLAAAHDAAAGQYGSAHALTLRTALGLAELSQAAGDLPKAQLQLLDIVAGLRTLGAQNESILALALVTLGDVELSQGQFAPASKHLQEAVALREKTPDDLWELAQARERLGETLLKSAGAGAGAVVGAGAAAPALLKKAAQDLETQLGANHPETLRAKAAVAQLPT
jgi:non-specific serine/threonine protein kinase/serine/threonine-protein kinase